MILDTLYKRSKTGKIQYWKVSTFHDTIFKESGSLGTLKPIKHEEICAGKNIGKSNETTPQHQAELQAMSDWKGKRDEGYKSLSDIGITDTNPSGDPHRYGFSQGPIYDDLAQVLDLALPQFNTDASGNVKPMLAKAVDWKKVKYPCFVQPKLDGVRCLMIVDFTTPKPVTFLSRSGKPYTTLDHISTTVMKSNGKVPIKFVLDGEIYSDELTFQEITQAVKKQYPNSLKLKFRAYDIVNDKPCSERMWDTKELVEKIKSDSIQFVDTVNLQNKEEVMNWHNDWVSQGYEGAMIRHYTGTYGQGQRSSDLLKVKEFDETELKFMYWEYGQRKEDLIAVCMSDKGEVRAKMVGTKIEKEELEKRPQHTGLLTIKHFGLTDEGLLRFPIGKSFRDYE